MLHPDDVELFERVQTLGNRLADSIGKSCTIEPKRRPNGAYGLCYYDESRIAILIRRKEYAYDGGAWSNKPFSWNELSETVAHEVAHLVHRNHGKDFKELERELISLI